MYIYEAIFREGERERKKNETNTTRLRIKKNIE